MPDALKELQEQMLAFCEERDWLKFHSPKNLAMDISCEAAEIAEHFRWLTEEASYTLDEKTHEAVRDEVGDVLIALVHFAHILGIDPLVAAHEKLKKIGTRYPVEKCKGKALKYTEYEN